MEHEDALRDKVLKAAFHAVAHVSAGENWSGMRLITTLAGIADAVYTSNARAADLNDAPHCGCDYHGDRLACDTRCGCRCRFVTIRLN